MKIDNKQWYVDKGKVRTDYVVIENLQQFLIKEVPYLNPDHPEYIKFWSKETKKCIEGIWGQEFGKYRYMPGILYFFGNWFILEHTYEKNGVKYTEDIKPYIVDYLWEFAYQSWWCYGFSGFEKDTLYSCHDKLKLYHEGRLEIDDLPPSCLHKGEAKLYEKPYEYLYRLHDKPLGKPLFENQTTNAMLFGSRGGSKSYYAAAELEYNYIFCGSRRFDTKFIENEFKSSQVVGSSETSKSSELLTKFEHSQACKANGDSVKFRKWFGIWVESDSDGKQVVTPCPFYKRSSGTLACPNKDNPYRAKYKVDINGQWKEFGTGSFIAHVNYSTKKGNGARAAEGGRYLLSITEEVGSLENYVDVLGANEGTVSRAGNRFGYQLAMGTSGNITYVQAAKRVFLNPSDYLMASYKNAFTKDGKNGETCYFIPFYITLFQFKDKNGNTDYKKAIDYVNREREKYANSSDPRVLRDFLMNKPCYPHEMWLTDKGYYLPYEEAAERERELMSGQLYKDLGHDVELVWLNDNKVAAKQLHEFKRICDWPLPKDLTDPSGCVVIYEYPEDNIPNDMYSFIGHDPYVEEDIDFGGSLGVTYILKNPKYTASGHTGNVIVASYIGKPIKGLKYYYEQQEKLLAFYGNPQQGLWYEKNRGEMCREYYMNIGKAYLLCLTPDRTQGGNIYQRNIQSFGYNVGNRVSKLNLLRMLHDWLLEETTLMENGQEVTKKNIFRIPCIFLIRQIMDYDLDGNYDAVSGFIGCILGLREMTAKIEQNLKRKNNSNLFEHLLKNNRIFNVKAT